MLKNDESLRRKIVGVETKNFYQLNFIMCLILFYLHRKMK